MVNPRTAHSVNHDYSGSDINRILWLIIGSIIFIVIFTWTETFRIYLTTLFSPFKAQLIYGITLTLLVILIIVVLWYFIKPETNSESLHHRIEYTRTPIKILPFIE